MSLRVALVGPIAAPLTEPVAGGLERLLIDLARGLYARGHTVRLFGAAAGPPDLDFEAITPTPLSSDRRVADDCPPEVYQPVFIDEHIAYLTAADQIRADDHDIVHSDAVGSDAVEALAAALIEARACDRAACRANAQRLGVDEMVGRYETLYEEIIRADRAL